MDCRPQSTACVARLTTHRRGDGKGGPADAGEAGNECPQNDNFECGEEKDKPIWKLLSEGQVLRGLGMAGAGCDDAMMRAD